MKNQATKRGGFAAVLKGTLAVLLFGVCGHGLSGQNENLLQNGDFATDLNHWTTEGVVTGGLGRVTLSENGTEPVIYQAIDVASHAAYAYELRFNLYVGDMSSSSGSGEPDRGRLSVLGGTSVSGLNPDSAAEEIVLVEASAAGPVAIASNISGVPNPALGPDWYSVVVEFVSDYTVLAPYATMMNKNGASDSSLVASDVRFYALNRGRLANISNRGPVGTNENIMIPGFVIVGTTKKDLVFRGVGPTLGAFGVPGTIADPTIGLFPSGATSPSVLNDNWGDDPDLAAAFNQVGAFALEAGSLDAALVVRDMDPGAYTVQIAGVGGGTGVALAEIYDMTSAVDGPTELTNISNRGFVGEDAAVQIPGFVISGTRGKKVLVRAVGPTLAGFGVGGALEDPFLQLFRQGEEEALVSNDNWEDNVNAPQIAATAMSVGAFALDTGSADSSILTALEPGSYTAVARGVGGSTGIALVEVYMVTSNQRPVPFSNSLYVNSSQANILNMDEILGNDLDPDGDLLHVFNFTDPTTGTLVMNDMDELVFTGPIGFFGESVFSYSVTDGEYESVPATVALQVAPANAAVWVGGSSGTFSDPANWRDGEVPGTNDPVWIGQQGETTITVNQDATVASVRAGATGSMVTLVVSSGRTLTAAGGIEIRPNSTLEINNGTIATNQNVLIHGNLKWNGGEMNGNTATVIAVGATAEIVGGQNRLTGNRRFINRGMLTQSGAAYIYSSGGSNSTVTNAETGTWRLLSNNNTTFAYNDGSSVMEFVNAGELTKSTETGLVYFGTHGGTSNFTNAVSGMLNVAGGTFSFNGGGAGAHSGALVVASGAEVSFNRGTHTFDGGSTISEDGELHVASNAIVNLPGAYTFESLRLSNGTLKASGDITVATYVQTAGVFESAGDLIVTDSFTWNGGTQKGAGLTSIGAEAMGASASGQLRMEGGRDLTSLGEFTQSGSGYFYAVGGSQSTVTNGSGATWDVTMNNGHTMAYQDGSSTMNFVNLGTLEKINATALLYFGTTSGASNFTNEGTVSIVGGTFQFNGVGTGTHNGDLSIASGGTALFARGTHTFGAEATISDTGTVQLNHNAVVTLPGDFSFEILSILNGTLNAAGDLTVATFGQTAGIFSGTGDLTVTSVFGWTGGTQTGAGATIIASEATGSATAGQLRMAGGRMLTNLGTFNQSGGSYFYAVGGSQSSVTNANGATWNLSVNNNTTYAYNDNSSTMNFVNDGTLAKVNASGLVYFGTSGGSSNFTNTGTLTISGGTLLMNGSGTGTFGGSTSIAATGELRFDRGTHTFPSGALISGDGLLYIYGSGATVTLVDGYTLKQINLRHGALNANGAITVESFSQSNGTYGSNQDLTVTGTLSFTGGTGYHSGSGDTIIASEATATFVSGSFRLLAGRDLVNNGAMNQSGGTYFYGQSGTNSSITNSGGATWTLSSNNGTTFAYQDSSSSITVTNNGDMTKTSTGRLTFGTSSGSSTLVNNGSIDVSSGTLYLQSGSRMTLSNASNLTIQTSTTTKGIEGNCDLLTFGGTLVLKSGITPPTGQAIRIIDFDARSGTFNTITPPQGVTLQNTTYDDTNNNGFVTVTF